MNNNKKKYLQTAIPKNIAIVTYEAYDEQNGVAPTAIVDITRQMLLSNNESTHGKSATYPHNTRPNVFVIPITDIKNDAEL